MYEKIKSKKFLTKFFSNRALAASSPQKKSKIFYLISFFVSKR